MEVVTVPVMMVHRTSHPRIDSCPAVAESVDELKFNKKSFLRRFQDDWLTDRIFNIKSSGRFKHHPFISTTSQQRRVALLFYFSINLLSWMIIQRG